MNFSIDKIREVYRLNSMSRYNTWPRINSESVAAHCYFVSLFTKMICDELHLNATIKSAAIEYALVHDAAESLMNDITYDAKRLIPGLKELLDEFEKEYISENFPNQYNSAFGQDQFDSLVRAIVKLADIYSVIQYCDNEVSLGNTPFVKMLEDTKSRAQSAINQLEGRLKMSCQKITISNL